MTTITIICDRCNKELNCIETEHGTIGFYRLEGIWNKYGRTGELTLCDECMWNDELYKIDYSYTYTNSVG